MTDQQLEQQIAALRRQFSAVIAGRITIISRFLAAAHGQDLDPAARQEAVWEAHKLVGSLGTLGWPRASEMAREIERSLSRDRALSSSEIEGLQALLVNLKTEVGSIDGDSGAAQG